MTESSKIVEAAKRLREASANHALCDPVRDLLGIEDLASAYKVQNINKDLLIKAGARVVGKKIGLTSKSVQEQLGVGQPDYGSLFDTTEVLNGGEISMSELMQPKVEAEIAFVLSKNLPGPSITSAEMMAAVDFALISIEIVGSRIRDWNIRITDTIADNASASHFVLGHKPTSLVDLDLVNCKMTMEKNGDQVSIGTGSACLGSPINAAIWLAKKMASLGDPLKAGDIILTGALGPMAAVVAGDFVRAEIEGLGEVSVMFKE